MTRCLTLLELHFGVGFVVCLCFLAVCFVREIVCHFILLLLFICKRWEMAVAKNIHYCCNCFLQS